MVENTVHSVFNRDARDLSVLPDEHVDLVATSPPYPMIDMWDDVFSQMNPSIESAIGNGDVDVAYGRMHQELRKVWVELERVVKPGGVVCINIGDATRTVDGTFQLFPNHAKIAETMRSVGFTQLPGILWRKPSNNPTKFMGSGMTPPNQYVTHEHEHILIFRKGSLRSFDRNDERRYESAYFWEERNEWFSDLWTNITGVRQSFDEDGSNGTRTRSGAFPFIVPYRLIQMFSVYDDVVLDPFAGTGTTMLASMVGGRNSIGVEIDPGVIKPLTTDVAGVISLTRDVIEHRVERHQQFVHQRRNDGSEPKYESEYYPFNVTTEQERGLRFYNVDDVSFSTAASSSDRRGEPDQEFEIDYEPFNGDIPSRLSRFENTTLDNI